jgi:hypothetical protein
MKDLLSIVSENVAKSKNNKDELLSTLERLQLKRDEIRSESLDCKPLKEIMREVFKKLNKASNETKKAIFNSLIKEIRVLKENKLEVIWLPEVCGSGGQSFDLGEKWGGFEAAYRTRLREDAA